MTTGKLFGTDGIRGSIKLPPLLPENFALLGRILAGLVRRREDFPELAGSRNLITIGRDTRSSGVYLESALIAGISAVGVDCELVGVMPTAAVAQAAIRSNACLGLIISASHNPYNDNGIKVLDSSGLKISESLEQVIEQLYLEKNVPEVALTPGKTFKNLEALSAHLAMLKASIADPKLIGGMKLVVDCANGAASVIASAIFAELAPKACIIGNEPDGSNINRDFGSEAPKRISEAVLQHGADLGIAFDGDADRVIFIDELGQIMDGDAILAALAIHCLNRGLLTRNTLVATVMSSVALDRALEPYGISVLRTEVGDKYVARAMLQGGFSLGGENSGHIILFPQASTGDGVLSALLFLEILVKSKKRASELLSFFEPVPKLLTSIFVSQKPPLSELSKTQEIIEGFNAQLKEQGRVFLRYSGTENKARLLVEAQSELQCRNMADLIIQQFTDEIEERKRTN